MELICPDIWFMVPPLLAITPRLTPLLLYIPALGCVGYWDWDCWGYTLGGRKLSQHISSGQKDTPSNIQP